MSTSAQPLPVDTLLVPLGVATGLEIEFAAVPGYLPKCAVQEPSPSERVLALKGYRKFPMARLFAIFDIAKLGLQANQRALQVVSQTLANVNTPGFSRQEAIFQETQAINVGAQLLGTGVEIVQVRRLVNNFVEAQINVSQQDTGRLQAQQDAFARVE